MGKLGLLRMACIGFTLCATTATISTAQTFTSLLSFNSTDGDRPLNGSLVQGADGNLYGTTDLGGVSSNCTHDGGCGTVFEITPDGELTTLYNFCAQAGCTDGEFPGFGLVLGTDGNFYGTTEQAGPNGFGTVFQITSAGVLTTLHGFDYGDGSVPTELVQAANGNFYGTTQWGGTGTACSSNVGCGTVFKITSAGTFTKLYNFCSQTSCTDGTTPLAGLVQARNGNFYGTTEGGGTNGDGTVFAIAGNGKFTTLYSFCSQANCNDGEFPQAGLVQATNGSLYGTTSGGGTSALGTVFAITTAGNLTTLYNFCSLRFCNDGAVPSGALVQGSDGNLFGTTLNAGLDASGSVFGITPAGRLTTLHVFDASDGELPYAQLLQTASGIFYGITSGGGTNGNGTVFSLSLATGSLATGSLTTGESVKGVSSFR